MNAYYPAMLRLTDRKVLFIGGGWETEHKVRGLLDAGAQLTLISATAHPELEALEREGRLLWHRREYQAGDLAGFWLVMSHPHDKAENAPVWAEAEARGILCNCVDDPERCSFILPSVVRRGDLILSVSTSGVAPALGVRIKQRLAEQYGPEYAQLLGLLQGLRPKVTAGFGSFETRKQFWYRLVDSAALGLVRENHLAAAETLLTQMVAEQRLACQAKPCVGCTPNACAALQVRPPEVLE